MQLQMALSLMSSLSLMTIVLNLNVSVGSYPVGFVDDQSTYQTGYGHGNGHRGLSSSIFGDEYIHKVERALKESYGDTELLFFRNMIRDFESRYDYGDDLTLNDPALEEHIRNHMGEGYMKHYSKSASNEDPEMRRIARALVFLIRDQFNTLDQLQKRYLEPNMERFSQIQELSKDAPVSTDTPCITQAACDKLEMLINLCSYIRNGTHKAYEIFVVMVHVLGTMMAVLCGCLFVGPAQICFLKNFPYTCRIPFPVFSGMFQSTLSVWELVKVSTNICRIYGDPGFGSIFA